jgi:hypothetical protein
MVEPYQINYGRHLILWHAIHTFAELYKSAMKVKFRIVAYIVC